MYSDEWKAAMTADSMQERIQELATVARRRAERRDEPIQQVVHEMTHDAYLLKHTTDDVLRELAELQDLYAEEFYDGTANDHIMSYLENDPGFDVWHDYLSLALAAGLEWALLHELEASPTTV